MIHSRQTLLLFIHRIVSFPLFLAFLLSLPLLRLVILKMHSSVVVVTTFCLKAALVFRIYIRSAKERRFVLQVKKHHRREMNGLSYCQDNPL